MRRQANSQWEEINSEGTLVYYLRTSLDMDRTLVKSDHTFETKGIEHLGKSSTNSFQFSIQLPLLRSINCAKSFSTKFKRVLQSKWNRRRTVT